MDAPQPRRVRAPDEPRFSVRQWCWILLMGLIASQVLYVLSWPFVLRITGTIKTVIALDPDTGVQRSLIFACRDEPLAETAYCPVEYAAYRLEIPVVSCALRSYDDLIAGIEIPIGPLKVIQDDSGLVYIRCE